VVVAAHVRASYRQSQPFFLRMVAGMALFIVLGFGQFAARGLVDYARVPIWVHLHGIAMVAWLALLVTQTALAGRPNLQLHRQLGWFGAVLATAVVALGLRVVVAAIGVDLVPPFFTPAFLLALATVDALAFGSLVAAAIVLRRRSDWHSRLLVGSTAILMEPALGRVLPMPLLGGDGGEWLAMAFQLIPIVLLLRHDRKALGTVHPASLLCGGAVVASHVLVKLASLNPAVLSLATSLGG
jgi:hypothetical protein